MVKLSLIDKPTKLRIINSMGKLKVAVIGASNSGKSTFINALCGRFVVPECSHTSTLVTTYLGPIPKYVEECAICDSRSRLRKFSYNDFLTGIQYSSNKIYDNKKNSYVNKSAFVNIKHSLSSQGIILIDTIGTSVNDYDTECTAKVAKKADVIIYMYDASKSANIPKEGSDFLRKVLFTERNKATIPFERIYFVPNKIDCVSSVSSVMRSLKCNLQLFVDKDDANYKIMCDNIIPISALLYRLATVGIANSMVKSNLDEEELNEIIQYEQAIAGSGNGELFDRSNIEPLIKALLNISKI